MKTTSTAQKMEQKNEIPMLTVVTPEKEVKTEIPAEPAKTEAVKPQLTIEEIKRKNEILRRLTQRYDEVSLKLFKIENFKISSQKVGQNGYFIRALAQVKKASAQANLSFGKLTETQSLAIQHACDALIIETENVFL